MNATKILKILALIGSICLLIGNFIGEINPQWAIYFLGAAHVISTFTKPVQEKKDE